MKIDLNCDLGESFGRYTLGNDAAIMPHISSANVACGFHAGDARVMQATVSLAKRHGVAVGAHPGWPDLQGFGRRKMDFSPDEAEAITLYQVGALAAIARAEGVMLCHVKPHGAMYNQAAVDGPLARAIARGVKRFSGELILVGLAGSSLIEAGLEAGLRVAQEGFPDRAYAPDGTLLPRSEKGALVESPELVAGNAVRLATEGILFGEQRMLVDTICLHGDTSSAVQNAKGVREALAKAGVDVERLR
jgi:UPF0271 protein